MATDDDVAQLKALARRSDATLWEQADALVARLGDRAVEALDDILAMDVGDDREFAAARCRTLMAITNAQRWGEVLSTVRLAVALLIVVDADRVRYPMTSTFSTEPFQEAEDLGRTLLHQIRWRGYDLPKSMRAPYDHALENTRQAIEPIGTQISPELREEFARLLRAFPIDDTDPASRFRQLGSTDPRERKDAMAHLVAFGEEAVPMLKSKLDNRYSFQRSDAVEPLAIIGGRSAVWALLEALPYADQDLYREITQALERAVLPLVDPPHRADFDLLLTLLGHAKDAPKAADRAAEAIAGLARSAPFRELRLALKPLRGGLLNPPSPAFAQAHAAVEAATAAWADLPLPALPPSDADDLPRPSEKPDGD